MRRAKPRYKAPRKPWESKRIKEENVIVKGYGLVNKREIWKTADKLRNWREQAKNVASLIGEAKDKRKKILIDSLAKFGVIDANADTDLVLALTLKDLLERRLQTIIYRKGLAITVKQARQFIVHNKVLVNGRKINAPSYMVKVNDDVKFVEGFNPKLSVEKFVGAAESKAFIAPQGKPSVGTAESETKEDKSQEAEAVEVTE